MKSFRYSDHALTNLKDREIDRAEVDATLSNPKAKEAGQEGRQIYMRLYHDAALEKEMLLRVIVEETESELVVITVYKTSQIKKYLKGDRQ